MQADSVATIASPDVDYGMDVIGNDETNGFLQQQEERLFEVC